MPCYSSILGSDHESFFSSFETRETEKWLDISVNTKSEYPANIKSTKKALEKGVKYVQS